MSHKYERLLQGILQEPVSGNIHWREVESLLHHLGATVSTAHGARVHVVLNKVEVTCTDRITAASVPSRRCAMCASFCCRVE